MGIELLTEEIYRKLQTLGEVDRRTSSWIDTSDDVRGLGGALVCDRRYGRVFVYLVSTARSRIMLPGVFVGCFECSLVIRFTRPACSVGCCSPG